MKGWTYAGGMYSMSGEKLILAFWRWLRRTFGLYGLLALAGLLAFFGNLIYAFVRVNRLYMREGSSILILFVLVLTWWLAHRRAQGWQAASVVFAVGVVYLTIRVGGLWPTVWGLFAEGGVRVFWSELNAFASQVGGWGIAVVQGTPYTERFATQYLWDWLFWSLSAWAAWWLFRRGRPLVGVLPAAGMWVSMASYAWQPTFSLVVMAAIVLALVALHQLHAQETDWSNRLIAFSEELRMEYAVGVFGIILIVSGYATIVTLLPLENLSGLISWRLVQGAENQRFVNNVLGLDARDGSAIPASLRQVTLPNAHLLGAGPELGERVVFTVRVQDPARATSEAYYWKTYSFGEYTGRGWETGDVRTIFYDEAENVTFSRQPKQRRVRQDMRARGQRGVLFATGDIATANRAFRLAWREPVVQRVDIVGGTIDARNYRVDSWLPEATPEELRATTIPLPKWVTDTYLSLPTTVPTRVITLAQQIVADAPTRYDKALALEQFLRTSFPYTLDITTPPPRNRDVADYFLFDLQRGYCDYYATTMVVMARAVGVPARLAMGYAQGEETAPGVFTVTEANAHAWVEVFFPGYGWVNFEPTAGLPALARDETLDSLATQDVGRALSPFPTFGERWTRTLTILLLAAGYLAGVVWVVVRWHRRRAFAQMTPTQAVLDLYGRVYGLGRPLRVRSFPGQTAAEYAYALGARMVDLLTKSRAELALPRVQNAVKMLTNLHDAALFQPEPLTDADKAEALRHWQTIAPYRFRMILRARFPRKKPETPDGS